MRRAATLLLALLLVTPAYAMRAPDAPIPGNPANKLADQPIEDFRYDDATHCTRKRRAGVDAFAAWLARNTKGTNWGSYRCEMWGKREASLHAEGRALDWHPANTKEPKRLIALLLAPDPAGNEQALARRMGVQEIIWDCGYWRSGMPELSDYAPCFNKHGRRRKKVNATVAHRDHIHFGFTKPGASRRTSFWR